MKQVFPRVSYGNLIPHFVRSCVSEGEAEPTDDEEEEELKMRMLKTMRW
jgi:hypothetical protein